MTVPYEDPRALLSRLALGREEFCQRLLTMLILGGPYPRWNSRSTPSPEGLTFLRLLDALSFGESRCTDDVLFVDELELAPLRPLERGGAPDWAVLAPDRLWLVELKTEAGSHRPDQLPSYLRLGAHHFPQAALDITYLTPPLTKPTPDLLPGQRYAHVTWTQVAPLVREVWGAAAVDQVARVRDGLLTTLDALELPVAQWRAAAGAVTSPPEVVPEDAVALARQTAADGRQRAVDVQVGDLQALHDQRVELLGRLGAEPTLDHVLPWVWNAETSGGRPLTAAGAENGFELRLSRYGKPVR